MRVAFFGRKSRRADNHPERSPILVVQQEGHFDSAVDQVDQSTKLGSRKGVLCTAQNQWARPWAAFGVVH